jgi:hypothetical protein
MHKHKFDWLTFIRILLTPADQHPDQAIQTESYIDILTEDGNLLLTEDF